MKAFTVQRCGDAAGLQSVSKGGVRSKAVITGTN